VVMAMAVEVKPVVDCQYRESQYTQHNEHFGNIHGSHVYSPGEEYTPERSGKKGVSLGYVASM
jgi:hypothetical protein